MTVKSQNKLSEEVQNKVERVLNSSITGYQIYKRTGIEQSQISRLRRGLIDLDNVRFNTIKALLDIYDTEFFRLTEQRDRG